MADQDLRAAVDRLSRSTTDARGALERDARPSRSAEELLGLRFKPRDKVIDTVTGKRATVHSGRKAEATGRGVYVIALASGELTHRDERELEPDQAPAPAPTLR